MTLLPVTIFTHRAQMGAADPTDVFITLLQATSCSTLAGLAFVAAVQRIRLIDPLVLGWLIALSLTVGALAAGFASLPA